MEHITVSCWTSLVNQGTLCSTLCHRTDALRSRCQGACCCINIYRLQRDRSYANVPQDYTSGLFLLAIINNVL